MKPAARILLAEDHALVQAAFASLLQPRYEVVGRVSDGRALLREARQLRPDVIVSDLTMPLLSGLEAFRQLHGELRETKWVFVTVNEDPDLAVEAFRLGASGYLLKHSAAGELFAAIETALQGGRHLTPLLAAGASVESWLARATVEHVGELTARQREVLQLLAEGHVMKEVARLLGISERTVAFHKYEAMHRLRVKSTPELVRHAVKLGLVPP